MAALTLSSSGARALDEPPVLSVSGLLQVDSVLLDQTSVDELDPATGAPLNMERFVLQRGWLGGHARYAFVRGDVVLEASTARGPVVRPLAAELTAFYEPEAQPYSVDLTLGMFLIPFGIETREPVPPRLFLEASTWVGALFPGRRDLGARVRGEWSFLRLALAVMNGEPNGSGRFPLRDPNRAKDVLGRLGAEGQLTSFLRGAAGVSALYGRGFHPGVAPSKDTFTVRDVNEDGIVQPSEIQLVAGEPGEPSRNFTRAAFGGDLTLAYELPYLGPGHVYSELVWAQNLDRALFVADPITSGRNLYELGAMVALRQHITPHAELGVRYDHYDPDHDARQRRGTRVVPVDATFDTLSLALAWCTLSYLRVTLEYDHGRNPLGRDARGAPATLAADRLILRGQLEL